VSQEHATYFHHRVSFTCPRRYTFGGEALVQPTTLLCKLIRRQLLAFTAGRRSRERPCLTHRIYSPVKLVHFAHDLLLQPGGPRARMQASKSRRLQSLVAALAQYSLVRNVAQHVV
jgi:hypothetical protein